MDSKIKFSSESTLAQQCYEQLQNDIINGIFKPGEKLKVASIKSRFSVGQSPVREALSRLVASGLVETQDNKGFNVSKVSEENIRDIYKTFTIIENTALELSIKNGDEQWHALIVSELYKLSLIEKLNSFDSYCTWAERNYNFHLALISACNSPTLLEIRRNLYMKFDRYCKISYQIAKNQKNQLIMNNEEHQNIASAAIKRDVKTAQELTFCHLNGALESVIKKFKENNII